MKIFSFYINIFSFYALLCITTIFSFSKIKSDSLVDENIDVLSVSKDKDVKFLNQQKKQENSPEFFDCILRQNDIYDSKEQTKKIKIKYLSVEEFSSIFFVKKISNIYTTVKCSKASYKLKNLSVLRV